MDITSTSASTVQVNKPATNPIAAQPAATPIPEDTNLKAIQAEIKQITDEMKQTLSSKLQPLPKDTIELSKPQAAQEVAPPPQAQAPIIQEPSPEALPAPPAETPKV